MNTGTIAIACNPQSGKDIRRLWSSAMTVSDVEKANTIERILITAESLCSPNVVIMPERLGYGRTLKKKSLRPGYPISLDMLEIFEMNTKESHEDTTNFATAMEARGVDVIIVMGGDGTSRAASKGLRDTPLVAVSTGTNNVFPEMLEGTVVGMAAAALAAKAVSPAQCTHRVKQIEVIKNGVESDVALIDLVFCRSLFTGAKAIRNYEEIEQVVVTQCHMASIGFSALVAPGITVRPEDAFGASACFSTGEPNAYAPMSAGYIQKIHISQLEKLELGREVTRTMEYPGMIALDGEREIPFLPGDRITYRITQNGPRRVDIKRTLDLARELGFFQISPGKIEKINV